jgi:predicted dinucleotide-binding enzyme
MRSASSVRAGSGERWDGFGVTAGHDVMFSSRHPSKFDDLVRTLGAHASAGRRRKPLRSVRSSSSPCPTELPKIGRGLRHLLDSKIVLDSCNPYVSETEEMRREVLKEGVAIASAHYLPGSRLVRALSAGDATSVQDSAAGGHARLGVPIASDDAEAMEVVKRLVRDAGCEPVVVGGLAAARSLQRGGPGFRANTDAPALRRSARPSRRRVTPT